MTDRDVIGVEIVHGEVASDWIDVNGHMNVANYLQAFDDAVVRLRQDFGVTEDYVRNGHSTFAVECHMTYQRELTLRDPYVTTSQRRPVADRDPDEHLDVLRRARQAAVPGRSRPADSSPKRDIQYGTLTP
jgi:hypothetical protein